MANDDSARPKHAEDMPRVDPPVLDERIVRVDAAQDRLVAGFGCDVQDAVAEDSGTWAEEAIGAFSARAGVGAFDHLVDGGDLFDQDGRGEGDAWFVVHGVVAEFVAGFDDVCQNGFVAGDLVANHKERCVDLTVFQYLQDISGVLTRCVVDGQSDDFVPGGDLEEHLWEPRLEVVDNQLGRLVDYVCRQEDHKDDQEDAELDSHAGAAGSSAPASGEAKEWLDQGHGW